ncbi:unnamed protein product [Cylindrotheca closterium]|uniref:NADP-dependent oxidoreductase domain-containing protein n=1 Tax=Cylindrotheca closterium TaxID=2856 RepID=A0AAD2CEX4_9STRA|nr:unnamed protein product [Cylindrotheca closterium]
MKVSTFISLNILAAGSAFVPPAQPTVKAASKLEINQSPLNADRQARTEAEGSFQSSSSSSSSFALDGLDHNHHVNRRSAIAGSMGMMLLAPTAVSILAGNAPVANAAATTNTNAIPTWTLDNNVQMPKLALNTVGLSMAETEQAVQLAVAEGITHIDFHPGKERDGVAQYLAKQQQQQQQGGSSRPKLFLNTKIRKAPPGTSAKDAAERTRNQIDEDMKALNVTSVDMLMLRDSPDCDVMQAQWAVLEEALVSGKTRSIGVINFCEKALTCILQTAKVKPALDYYMLHVGMGRDPLGLRSFCDSKGIRTFAYGALGEPGPNDEILKSPLLTKIGRAHNNKSPEEVALRWVLQTGAAASVRPSTTFGLGMGACVEPDCGNGIAKRAKSYSWSLTDQEMAELDAMTSPNDNPTLFSTSGCPNAFVMPK